MSATTCCSQGGTAFAMTECKQSSFGFQDCGSREIVARFDGGTISSDGGAVLLRQTDHRLDLLPRLAQCFLDGRGPDRVQHSVQEMISQRVYGLALGYEDINDHERLRSDPLFRNSRGYPFAFRQRHEVQPRANQPGQLGSSVSLACSR